MSHLTSLCVFVAWAEMVGYRKNGRKGQGNLSIQDRCRRRIGLALNRGTDGTVSVRTWYRDGVYTRADFSQTEGPGLRSASFNARMRTNVAVLKAINGASTICDVHSDQLLLLVKCCYIYCVIYLIRIPLSTLNG